MRLLKRIVCLLMFASFSLPIFALTKQELDQKYLWTGFPEPPQLVGSISEDVQRFLQNGRVQEAIWLLEESGNESDARSLKKALFSMMIHGKIAGDGVIHLGGGKTVSKLVYFESGIKGVFKPAISHPSECYKCEIAAYLIDQMGKFALVPMTIEKQIGDRTGSLQYFVEGARDVNKEPDYQKSVNLSAFDYIIRNMDRTAKNVLIANNREVAIDHGNALRLDAWVALLRSGDLTRNLFGISTYPLRQAMTFPKYHPELFRASRRIIEALRQINHDMLDRHLSKLLPGLMIKKVSEKIAKLLQILDSQP